MVGIYYVLTYLGFGLPFLHAIVARKVGDVTTLLGLAAVLAACLALRTAIERHFAAAAASDAG